MSTTKKNPIIATVVAYHEEANVIMIVKDYADGGSTVDFGLKSLVKFTAKEMEDYADILGGILGNLIVLSIEEGADLCL